MSRSPSAGASPSPASFPATASTTRPSSSPTAPCPLSGAEVRGRSPCRPRSGWPRRRLLPLVAFAARPRPEGHRAVAGAVRVVAVQLRAVVGGAPARPGRAHRARTLSGRVVAGRAAGVVIVGRRAGHVIDLEGGVRDAAPGQQALQVGPHAVAVLP